MEFSNSKPPGLARCRVGKDSLTTNHVRRMVYEVRENLALRLERRDFVGTGGVVQGQHLRAQGVFSRTDISDETDAAIVWSVHLECGLWKSSRSICCRGLSRWKRHPRTFIQGSARGTNNAPLMFTSVNLLISHIYARNGATS
jgi:hypothetical protein